MQLNEVAIELLNIDTLKVGDIVRSRTDRGRHVITQVDPKNAKGIVHLTKLSADGTPMKYVTWTQWPSELVNTFLLEC